MVSAYQVRTLSIVLALFISGCGSFQPQSTFFDENGNQVTVAGAKSLRVMQQEMTRRKLSSDLANQQLEMERTAKIQAQMDAAEARNSFDGQLFKNMTPEEKQYFLETKRITAIGQQFVDHAKNIAPKAQEHNALADYGRAMVDSDARRDIARAQMVKEGIIGIGKALVGYKAVSEVGSVFRTFARESGSDVAVSVGGASGGSSAIGCEPSGSSPESISECLPGEGGSMTTGDINVAVDGEVVTNPSGDLDIVKDQGVSDPTQGTTDNGGTAAPVVTGQQGPDQSSQTSLGF